VARQFVSIRTHRISLFPTYSLEIWALMVLKLPFGHKFAGSFINVWTSFGCPRERDSADLRPMAGAVQLGHAHQP
jgi:hypothetical protein